MEDNKNPNYRISLQFSNQDPDQVEVANLLKQMGRKKSSFITKAVKYYLKEEPNAEIPGVNTATISKSSIRAILKELLSEMNLSSVDVEEPIRVSGNSVNTKSEALKTEKNPAAEEPTDEEVDGFLESLENWN